MLVNPDSLFGVNLIQVEDKVMSPSLRFFRIYLGNLGPTKENGTMANEKRTHGILLILLFGISSLPLHTTAFGGMYLLER
jgi:hypothetical protein